MIEQGCLISEGDLAGDVTSPAIQFDNVNRMSIQNVLTGSPVGHLNVTG